MKFENIYKETEENMRLALLSLWTPGNHPMRPAIEELFRREPLLAEPVFQSTYGWELATDETWRNALNPNVWKKLEVMRQRTAEEAGKKFRPFTPFKHQAESWKALAEKKSIVVTSGTGSGKTECFMYPVISDLYEQGRNNAIEAIFLYPLNALMEDQKKRLSEYCRATDLHFAVYNSNTQEHREDGRDELLPNEIATRDEIRDQNNNGTRPEILLTNPSMLEYILVRKSDQRMLQESAGKLRWIVIDEAHSYSGSAAVELAYQIKRILDAFNVRPEDVRFACTSATIGGEEGTQSLAEFISTITGQAVSQIRVIGGNRLVPRLDKEALAEELKKDNLPSSADNVLSLRDKINEVPGMTLQQMWEWLCPNIPYDEKNPLKALHLLDKLCEMKQDKTPVLSLRAHFFMRAISGLYACANKDCEGANPGMPLYGNLTTNAASACPKCGKPMLELVQCKRCGNFVLMGHSDSQTHKISSRENVFDGDDYFAIDVDSEGDEDDDEQYSVGQPDTFFLVPYEKEKFFNPVGENAHCETLDILHGDNGSTLEVRADNQGQWVEVRKTDGRTYCPSCGHLAEGKRLYFKHFRMPIDFINQTISPAILHECAHNGRSWGKYIAFTDSRQGTAISAKTFNINAERLQGYKNALKKLAERQSANTLDDAKIEEIRREKNIPSETSDETIRSLWASFFENTARDGLSLHDFSECIYNQILFTHMSVADSNANMNAYKAALLRNAIGRRPINEPNIENLGFIYLDYPRLSGKDVKVPEKLSTYAQNRNIKITDEDWKGYLKSAIDYVIRMENHIQPLIPGERNYVRNGNLGVPIAAPNDERPNLKSWPTVKVKDGTPEDKQPRLVLLLCAALHINSKDELRKNVKLIDDTLKEAWCTLVDKGILTQVTADDTEGYNNPQYYRRNEYVGCYYLDLSGRKGNDVCRIKRLEKAWICPVSRRLVDTLFCGYSPSISGLLSEKLFDKYRCNGDPITMPCRPKDDADVPHWLETDENVKNMKSHGIWTDRHKYAYCDTPIYIAAEHSAQQSRNLLREYTKGFSQENPTINVLHCSTTMEMGVDIGDIDVVLMDTVPPTAANYLQRVGRAGRMGQSKALAFSLCNNTPVGQQAFANPMWALQTVNHIAKTRPSQTIIQRHVNSYFFRQFICKEGDGIQTSLTVEDFMSKQYEGFVNFLDEISTDKNEEKKFHDVFGIDVLYTIHDTREVIDDLKNGYDKAIKEFTDAYIRFENNKRRQIAINYQIDKLNSENLLKFLSEHQFIPNANMPTGIVSFDFKDNGKSNTALRDIRTALNEYAPGQTVVINEKNYVSAGILFRGAYNQKTQTRGIYHCRHCGHTDYLSNLVEEKKCPVCGKPYHGIIDSDHTYYTLAYEPIGFCTDQSKNATREERTDKQYCDIRPILLNTDWREHTGINMCEIIDSHNDPDAFILFYNVGRGMGFAFCKHCGRAVIETAYGINRDAMPEAVRRGHNAPWGGRCVANNDDIARHVVLTGKHPTCYSVLRFKKTPGSSEYENDEQLVYSLGVVLKRALAQIEGIDESEIDFGTKQERNAWVLFIYDTAKGGCGYSLRFADPALCQEIFDLARRMLEEAPCNCQEEGGACTRCLIDRNNYRFAHLLSKAKALNWLNMQKNNAFEVTDDIKRVSLQAKAIYQPLKDIVKNATKDTEVTKLSLFVSDLAGDYAITDWSSVRSQMGKFISDAVTRGKKVQLFVEYHPELHNSLSEKLPFVNLKDKFPDCEVTFIKDMGKVKTAFVTETAVEKRRFFTDESDALSFSNNWGKNGCHVYVDELDASIETQDEPTYEVLPTQVVREGITKATSFQIKNYFEKAIAPYVLQSEDMNLLRKVLEGKHVDITFSDMYVNCALASLMLVYLIDELKRLFNFTINHVTLQLDSPKRNCRNDIYNDYTYISMNFRDKEMADEYTDGLFEEVLDVVPGHSAQNADHHRWLRIEASDGGQVEFRPDHGISGGYISSSRYMELDNLGGTVRVTKKDDADVLYYIIIKI